MLIFYHSPSHTRKEVFLYPPHPPITFKVYVCYLTWHMYDPYMTQNGLYTTHHKRISDKKVTNASQMHHKCTNILVDVNKINEYTNL